MHAEGVDILPRKRTTAWRVQFLNLDFGWSKFLPKTHCLTLQTFSWHCSFKTVFQIRKKLNNSDPDPQFLDQITRIFITKYVYVNIQNLSTGTLTNLFARCYLAILSFWPATGSRITLTRWWASSAYPRNRSGVIRPVGESCQTKDDFLSRLWPCGRQVLHTQEARAESSDQ